MKLFLKLALLAAFNLGTPLGIVSSGFTQVRGDVDPKFFAGMNYRNVGPSRGGRVTAVAGVPQKPFTFYMGAAGGGVWRTDDAGWNWRNISDGKIGAGSIGALAVAPSDPGTIYAGTGSACIRGNVSPGVGLYKTTNEGKSWQFVGLPKAGQIGKIVVHPANPDIAFVAALGNAFGPNPERGVYKTTDGGHTWVKSLFVSDSTGAIDIEMNPKNPKVLYAGMWRAERKPWTLIDGGQEGGIWRSTDMGETWEKLGGGLPGGLLGRIGLAVSPARPSRVWAIVQAAEEEKGGLYRSDDGGDTWERINRDHELRQRGWYYSHITADPKDPNIVYANNVNFYKSTDGGRTFNYRLRTPHSDNHGLWINPDNPDLMVQCNDGGANVSLNGGKTWSTQENQPTAELFRVTVDNQFPYRLYAGQQDNTTISVPSCSLPHSLTATGDWHEVGGGESADVAVNPADADEIYATSYSGEITYYNRKTGETHQVSAYPHYTEGTEQRNLKYRWQWNFPVLVSRFDPGVVYMASNYVHRSSDRGQSWQIVSPDLTTRYAEKLGIPGGPIQHDASGVEVYSSIFALEESPLNKGELWAGTDDGLIHITRDGGKTWKNITPPAMPAMGTVNKIELSTHQAGRALIAVQKYRQQDFVPYIFLTNDFGATWTSLTNGENGIPQGHFVRAIAEDPDRKGLLYAGTEFGMYVSFNEGKNWQPLQLNLPVTPITDIEVHEKDLVLSTQGRSFWILDDLTPLHQLTDRLVARQRFLMKPADAYRTDLGGGYQQQARIRFFLKQVPAGDTVRLQITDAKGNIAAMYSNKPDKNRNELRLTVREGINQVLWGLTYPAPAMTDDFVSMVFSAGQVPGPKAVPGIYTVQLKVGRWSETQTFRIKQDPRWNHIPIADYQAQFELATEIGGLLSESQNLIKSIRSLRQQAREIADNAGTAGYSVRIKEMASSLDKQLLHTEEALFQHRIETSQDEINYERKFSNHIALLYGTVVAEHNRPTAGMLERYEDLKRDFETLRRPYDQLIVTEFDEFNALLESENVPRVVIGK